MEAMNTPRAGLNMDRALRVVVETAAMDWEASPASGVWRKKLERAGESIPDDDVAVLETLCRDLLAARIKPYYLHHADKAPGTSHFRTTVQEGQVLVGALRGRLSGICQPTYVLDIPGGHGKSPIGPTYLEREDDGSLGVKDYAGNVHKYRE